MAQRVPLSYQYHYKNKKVSFLTCLSIWLPGLSQSKVKSNHVIEPFARPFYCLQCNSFTFLKGGSDEDDRKHARQVAERLILEAEKFKANVAPPKGEQEQMIQINQQFPQLKLFWFVKDYAESWQWWWFFPFVLPYWTMSKGQKPQGWICWPWMPASQSKNGGSCHLYWGIQ